ncbi:TPA_asm: coat protein [ssRNA phage Esthiorhiza.2_2]|uniref:Coat protein n=2 Tax=Leviviricetes TaxID=2842243 RepID=A0A8S5L368_9VIRU|nr:coat protein [ssRNA phage Esthiorhiza.2_2]QDH86851.1 MAG: hypothetical protein H2RhizoLitter491010_000003 [Leviviridae sp.]DAD52104.1 TPA_asm: coat protein [ssRNA phage Esthiorhiza.2_2]
MALTDPTTVTISGTAVVLPRVYGLGRESAYTSADGLVTLSVNHTLAKQGRERHVIRIDHSKLTANPFDSSQNMKVNMAAYTVFDLPPAGYTDPEALAVFVGFNTLLTANTNAVVTKVLGGES